MSKLAEFKALEAQLAARLKQLDALKTDSKLKREIEFEEKLQSLMINYAVTLQDIISILDDKSTPVPAIPASAASRARRRRQVRVYQHPETGEVVETKSGNHKVLKAWKHKYGAETVDEWLQ